MPSGATNRGRQREAEASRKTEITYAPRQLANLTPEEAAEVRKGIDQILWGKLRDPDLVVEEECD
jgi:hypothetical protein